MATLDPRDIITLEAFSVAPELLGMPLARPARRAAAIAVDLVLVAVLVALGGRLLFVLAGGWLFLRLARRRGGTGVLRRSWRVLFLVLAVILLLQGMRWAWNSITARVIERAAAPAIEESGSAGLSGRQGLAAAAEVVALRRVTTEEEAQVLARRVAERLHAQGLEPTEIREVIREAGLGSERPWAERVAEQAVQGLGGETQDTARVLSEDSLALAYAVAVEAGDSARIAVLRPRLAQAFAAERISALERSVSQLESRNQRLQRDLEEAREEWGILRFLRTVADELGLGFGWLGLYFTAFTALWRGQTPGKRLLRIRVLRLDGKPMGWWMSFERFGGYAAGLLTGLLGFFQIFWDRNRQGIHDKITETVVVRE